MGNPSSRSGKIPLLTRRGRPREARPGRSNTNNLSTRKILQLYDLPALTSFGRPLLVRSTWNWPAGQCNNGKELLHWPKREDCHKKADTATVSVGRVPNGACFPSPFRSLTPDCRQ